MKLTYAVYFPSCQSMFRGLNSEQAWRIKILFYPRPSIVHIRKIISLLFSYRIQPHRHFDSMGFFIKIYPHPQIPPTQTPHPHNPLIQHILNHPKPDLFNTVHDNRNCFVLTTNRNHDRHGIPSLLCESNLWQSHHSRNRCWKAQNLLWKHPSHSAWQM